MDFLSAYGVRLPGGNYGIAYPSLIGLTGAGIDKPEDITGLVPSGVWQWIHIAPFGIYRGHPKGEIVFSREAFQNIVKLFNRRSNPVKVDYEHDTLNKSLPGYERIAAGYIHRLDIRGDGMSEGGGLWGLTEFTPKAAEKIRAGEIVFNSPVIAPMSIDRKTGSPVGLELVQCAVTSDPFLDGQIPIQLVRFSMSDEHKKDNVQAATEQKPADKVQALSDEMAADFKGVVDKLASMTGLDASAVVASMLDQIEAVAKVIKIDQGKEGLGSEGDKASAAATQTAADSAGSDEQAALSRIASIQDKQLQLLSRRVEELESGNKKAAQRAIADMVDARIREKKIHASQREDAVWLFTNKPDIAEKMFSNPLAFTQTQATGEPPASKTEGPANLNELEKAQVASLKRAGYSDKDATDYVVSLR